MLHVDYNKVYACYFVKIFKNKPFKIFKQGGVRPVRRHWIHLWINIYLFCGMFFLKVLKLMKNVHCHFYKLMDCISCVI